MGKRPGAVQGYQPRTRVKLRGNLGEAIESFIIVFLT